MRTFKAKIKGIVSPQNVDANIPFSEFQKQIHFKLDTQEYIADNNVISLSDVSLQRIKSLLVEKNTETIVSEELSFSTLYEYINTRSYIKNQDVFRPPSLAAFQYVFVAYTFEEELEFNIEGDKKNFLELKEFLEKLRAANTFPVKKFYKNKGHSFPSVLNSTDYAPSAFIEIIQSYIFKKLDKIFEKIETFKNVYSTEKFLIKKLDFIKNVLLQTTRNQKINVIYHIQENFTEELEQLNNFLSQQVIVTKNIDKKIKSIPHINFFQIFSHGGTYGFDHDGKSNTPYITLDNFFNKISVGKIAFLSTLYCDSFKSESDLIKTLARFKDSPDYVNYSIDGIDEYAALLYAHGFILGQEFTDEYMILNNSGLIATFSFHVDMVSEVKLYKVKKHI